MEARRITEQAAWTGFRAVDEPMDEENEDDVEEEDESDEETKQDAGDVGGGDEDLTLEERRERLIDLMCERFLDGCDVGFADYSAIDADEALDDVTEMERDAEDRYFADESGYEADENDDDTVSTMNQAASLTSQRSISVGASTRKLGVVPAGSTRQLVAQPPAHARKHPLVHIDPSTRDRYLNACRDGDADAMKAALLKLQQQHPECAMQTPMTGAVPVEHSPFYNVLGAGLAAAASHNHTSLVEILTTGAYAGPVIHGICRDDTLFPPFTVPPEIPIFPVKRCTESMRFAAYAALACLATNSL
ncbi:hypothetical protein P43SY_000059 [Pythium insidiosum]|uniref:CCD97-like C-terminal domain-containing protein n=1 Tax=Pythium insidiosum TaxID=114742 RepID=A0AAD5Q322_PYTIN|nr:hypothetical protein P43SY_000059 [Pythium insidiosum]